MTSLSVVVPVWNELELVRECLASVERALSHLGGGELIVVDDGSSDGAPEMVAREFPAARLLRSETNHGFAHAANRGMATAGGELLLLLNSDTEIGEEDLERLVAFLDEHSDYAGVAPRLVGEEGVTQRACMAFPRFSTPLFFGTPLERWCPDSSELARYFLRDFDHEHDADVEQPPAACWLLRRAAWEGVGEFDERLELFFNDVDWCQRLKDRGGKLRFLASATVTHHGGASTRRRTDFVQRWQADRLRYQKKHHGPLAAPFVKACVVWTFVDWSGRNLGRRLRGRPTEALGPTTRALAEFLRA